jgi:hypothetical protein
MGTVGNNPAQFRAPTGTLSAGLQFDPPLTRLLQRNNFRQALIDYEQGRRQLIRYEDSVQETLRQLLRDLDQLRVNLQIQRRAVAIAIRRVDETQEAINQPPPPPQPGQSPGAAQLGPTTVLNLLTALADLRTSQDNLTSAWLNHYAQRMRLYRELGLMQLDACGMWIDRALAEADRATAEELPLPPPVPGSLLPQSPPLPPSSTPAGPATASPPPGRTPGAS